MAIKKRMENMSNQIPAIYFLIMPLSILYFFMIFGPLIRTILRMLNVGKPNTIIDTTRSFNLFSRMFFISGSQLTIISIALDIADLSDRWMMRQFGTGFSSGGENIYFVLPIILIVFHLQILIFTSLLERQEEIEKKEIIKRVIDTKEYSAGYIQTESQNHKKSYKKDIMSLLMGIFALFTNAISISLFLRPGGF
jgi:hypothetical protein